ncbi:MAG: hypothetical protein IH964_10675 [Candidatus Dadabacteria bacterium]|nr:hypothetical protein [Candidatus Dadabacteria bacterium]
MARSKGSQSKHDRTVKQIAKEFEQKGYDVEADIKGYSKPSTIGGLRPDVIATKEKERKIVEVETPDSLDDARDLKQKEAFRKASKRSKNTTFRRIITD